MIARSQVSRGRPGLLPYLGTKRKDGRRKGGALSDGEVKVSDKRMFTADGQLKEEYRFLDEEAAKGKTEEPPGPREPEPPPQAAGEPQSKPPRPPEPPPRAEPVPEPPPPRREAPPREMRDVPPLGDPASDLLQGEGPSFFDLLALLAEPASVYLGDVPLPGGQSAQDLDLARFHIDMLALLKAKTEGNLSAEESAVLDDLVYQLRMRYLQKRG